MKHALRGLIDSGQVFKVNLEGKGHRIIQENDITSGGLELQLVLWTLPLMIFNVYSRLGVLTKRMGLGRDVLAPLTGGQCKDVMSKMKEV